MSNFIKVFLHIQWISLISTDANPIHGPEILSATEDEFPFIASLLEVQPSRPEHHFCMGTLITKRHILTAKHCFEDPHNHQPHLENKYIKVKFNLNGLTQSKKYGIEKYETFEKWAADNSKDIEDIFHDVAIATLDEDVEDRIVPVKITDLSDEQIYGKPAVIAGYGATDYPEYSRFLHKALVKVLKKTKAVQNYEKGKWPAQWADNHLCTVSKPAVGVGEGDSGGPLLIEGHDGYELVGVHHHVSPGRADIAEELKLRHVQNGHLSVPYYWEFIDSYKKKMQPRRRAPPRQKSKKKRLFG